jgi:hypothetical protein
MIFCRDHLHEICILVMIMYTYLDLSRTSSIQLSLCLIEDGHESLRESETWLTLKECVVTYTLGTDSI